MEGVEVGQGEEVAVDLEVQRVVAEKGVLPVVVPGVVLQREEEAGRLVVLNQVAAANRRSQNQKSLHQVKKRKMRD